MDEERLSAAWVSTLFRPPDEVESAVADALEWAFILFRDPKVGGGPLTRGEYEDVAKLAVVTARADRED